MNLASLHKPELLELAKELRLDVTNALRKPELLEAILAMGAEDDERTECLDSIEEGETAKSHAKEREERERREQNEREERERKDKMEREEREHALEMKRLEIEMGRAQSAGQRHEGNSAVERVSFKVTELMWPYKLGQDIGLFLVNFERMCEKQRFSRESWPQRLLTPLPGEGTDVIARLTREEAEDYDKVKASLLRKYRLSAEAFRRKFRGMEMARNESNTEFAYKLMSNMEELLKEQKAYGDHAKVVQCFALEQFYNRLPENVRYWLKDRPEVSTIARAAELAEEFVARRAEEVSDGQRGDHKFKFGRLKPRPQTGKDGPVIEGA